MFTRIMIVLGVSAVAALADDGARTCSASSLRGTYGFTAQGFTVAGSTGKRN